MAPRTKTTRNNATAPRQTRSDKGIPRSSRTPKPQRGRPRGTTVSRNGPARISGAQVMAELGLIAGSISSLSELCELQFAKLNAQINRVLHGPTETMEQQRVGGLPGFESRIETRLAAIEERGERTLNICERWAEEQGMTATVHKHGSERTGTHG